MKKLAVLVSTALGVGFAVLSGCSSSTTPQRLGQRRGGRGRCRQHDDDANLGQLARSAHEHLRRSGQKGLSQRPRAPRRREVHL